MTEPWWSDTTATPATGDTTPLPAAGTSWSKPSKPSGQRPTIVTTAMVAGLVGALIGAGAVVSFDDNAPSAKASASSTRDPNATITQTGGSTTTTQSRPAGSVAAIAARVLPSVVTIEETSGSGQGTGSGVVLRSDGYILTNNHVVADVTSKSDKLVVIPPGKSESDAVDATVVGTDPLTDLAVIKADGGTWTAATLGKSEDLVVGDDVLAIGAPLGLRGTVTSGIVSALNRFVDIDQTTAYDRAIQTDAAINPGNSGGALVNASGEVIGINSAIATASGSGTSGGQAGSIGVGFAIPIDEAAPVATDIIKTGKASHPYLGVYTDDSTDPAGAVITSKEDNSGHKANAVTPGSPADKSGLKEGDVITKVADQTVTGAEELITAIREHRAGETVTLTYVRSGKTHTVQVTLAERPTSG